MNCSFKSIILLGLLFIGCHTAKKQVPPDHTTIPKHLDSCNLECLFNKINANQDLHQFTAKGTIKYAFADEHQDARITLYGIKDSLCLISLKKLGIEAFRIMLLPSRIIVLDRLNQEFSILNYTELQNQHQLEIQFDWLQKLLSSACFFIKDLSYFLTDSTSKFTINGISKDYKLACNLSNPDKLCEEFRLENEKHTIYIQAIDYLKIENRSIPSKFQIEFQSIYHPVLTLDLVWDEISLVPIQQIKFNIPDYYKKR